MGQTHDAIMKRSHMAQSWDAAMGHKQLGLLYAHGKIAIVIVCCSYQDTGQGISYRGLFYFQLVLQGRKSGITVLITSHTQLSAGSYLRTMVP